MSFELKILLVHCSYRNVGGEDKVFLQEREALRKKLGSKAVIDYHVQPPEGGFLKILLQILFPFKHTRQLRRLIREQGINVVHIHNFFPLLTFAVFKTARRSGAVVVHTLHNYRWWCAGAELYRKGQGICELCVTSGHSLHAIRYGCYRNSRLQSLFAVIITSLVKQKTLTAYVDYFIALSEFQKNWVEKAGIAEHKVILKPNGVEVASTCPATQKSGFVFVGRLESSKGIEEVLACWQANAIDETLTIIGSGSLESYLKQTYGHNAKIRFMGACSPQETLAAIDRSRYLLQPSLWYETFGLTIVEAMQLGVPVIGFAIGTRPDFITDGVNGFLCDPGSLGTTLQKAISFKSYEELSANAKKSAEKFMSHTLIERQLELYSEWVANR